MKNLINNFKEALDLLAKIEKEKEELQQEIFKTFGADVPEDSILILPIKYKDTIETNFPRIIFSSHLENDEGIIMKKQINIKEMINDKLVQ